MSTSPEFNETESFNQITEEGPVENKKETGLIKASEKELDSSVEQKNISIEGKNATTEVKNQNLMPDTNLTKEEKLEALAEEIYSIAWKKGPAHDYGHLAEIRGVFYKNKSFRSYTKLVSDKVGGKDIKILLSKSKETLATYSVRFEWEGHTVELKKEYMGPLVSRTHIKVTNQGTIIISREKRRMVAKVAENGYWAVKWFMSAALILYVICACKKYVESDNKWGHKRLRRSLITGANSAFGTPFPSIRQTTLHGQFSALSSVPEHTGDARSDEDELKSCCSYYSGFQS